MKQKRKVKSLLPYKIDKDGTMLTILLLILSLVLCLGSASLMTVSVGATDDTGKYSMVYPGRDDRVEVLYGLQISDKNKLWDEFVNQFFMKDKTLYLSPNQVKSKGSSFNDNTVDTGKYINVLGGEDNNIKSDNITLIAGNGNEVEELNDNASILGGQSNRIEQTSSGAPAVIAGGDENKIINNNSNVIIGGYKNIIKNAENTVILGGEENTVDGRKNIIVGGSNVEVNGVDNVFVYSNSSSKFEPESSNAFYLNLSDGVGINADAARKGLSVSGAVGFGEIDINSKSCNENNIGVIGSWNGCLVGCTEKGKSNGKWELLDRGTECEKKCVGNCFYLPSDEEEKEDRHYTGFCTDHVSIENATRCTNGENNYYSDVVFQTVLIGASEECPVSGDNKCVYRCNPGSDLDETFTSCHQKCKLPWNPDEEVRHGYFTGAYNTGDAFCADDDDKKTKDTCANHKGIIVCDNGDWILADKKGKPKNPRTPATGYVYEFCMLDGYRCKTDTNNYNLTVDYIKNTLNDTSSNRVVKDRTNVNGRRGQYKICIDYNANGETPPDKALNGDSCDTGTVAPQPYHYKFIGCQTGNGYFPFTGNDGVVRCMKDCVLTGENGKLTSYRHNTSITGYKAKDVTCTGSCQSANIVCNDGTWKLGSANGSDATEYGYSSCTLHDKVCSSGYNIDQTIYNQYSGTSIYGLCDAYKASGNACIKQDSKFELIGCKPNNHTEPEHESWMKWCISNTKEVNCSTGGKDPSKYDFIITGVKITWSGSWNEGHWTEPKACEWKCREGHHLSGDYNNGGECVSNKMMVPCKTGWADGHVKYNVVNVEISWVGTWNEGHWTEPGNCEKDVGECEAGRCGNDCGSKTQEVLCTSPNPNMPTTGAHEINTGEIYTVSCGEKRYCDWMCDPSRHLENGECVPNVKQECVETGTLPEFAYFDHTKFDRVWQGEWDTGHWSEIKPCPMDCTGGYDRHDIDDDTFECVMAPGCGGDLSRFRGAEIVVSGADVMTNSEWTLYPTKDEAEEYTCSLACDANHVYIDGKCKRCPNGVASDQCTDDPVCLIDVDGIILATEAYLNDYSSVNDCKETPTYITGPNGQIIPVTPAGDGTSLGNDLLLTIECKNIGHWKTWFDSTGKSLLSDLNSTSLNDPVVNPKERPETPAFDLEQSKLIRLLSGAGVTFMLSPKVNCVMGSNGTYSCSCVYYGDCWGSGRKPLNLANSTGVIVYGSTYDENRPILGESDSRYWEHKDSEAKLKPNSCYFTCASGYHKQGYGCEKDSTDAYCDFDEGYFPQGYRVENTFPIDDNTTRTIYRPKDADYGPYFSDAVECPDGGCNEYYLRGKGCAWACEPNTKLAKKVTKEAYEGRGFYVDDFFCRKKCESGEYYDNVGYCRTCSYNGQLAPDTGYVIGPVNGVGVRLTGSKISEGNPVDCKRICGKYENYDASTEECKGVTCNSGSYINLSSNSLYGCIICETDKGYEPTGWDEKYGVYTGCVKKCKSWEKWDNINKVCYVEQCDEDEYMDDYGNCNTCPEGQVVDTGSAVVGGNYTECKNICPSGQTFYIGRCVSCPSGSILKNGVCIGGGGQMSCPSGFYRKKDANGNFVEPIQCFTCHDDEEFDEETWECVDKNS